jgi:hypothetical protein
MTKQPIELDARRSVVAQRAIETHRRWRLANPRPVPLQRLVLDDLGNFPCEMPDAPWLLRSGGTQSGPKPHPFPIGATIPSLNPSQSEL